jgi:hypothetical protein
MSGHWVWGCTEADWNNESSILNGRYIYSFRGAAGTAVDRYDIALNTWTSPLTYSPWNEFFGTGTKYVYNGDALYIQKDVTGRWFRFDIPKSALEGWGSVQMPQGAAILGDTAFDASFIDGATKIPFIYFLMNTHTQMLRCMVI